MRYRARVEEGTPYSPVAIPKTVASTRSRRASRSTSSARRVQYVVRIPIAQEPQDLVIVERHVTEPARRLRDRLRRRREVTVVEVVGMYLALAQTFTMSRRLNGPETIDLEIHGRDALSTLARPKTEELR